MCNHTSANNKQFWPFNPLYTCTTMRSLKGRYFSFGGTSDPLYPHSDMGHQYINQDISCTGSTGNVCVINELVCQTVQSYF